MANERETGGPAFPTFCEVQDWDDDKGKYRDRIEPMGGMTLRDYFAAKALGMALTNEDWVKHLMGTRDAKVEPAKARADAATFAYRMADAMLAERSK